MSEQRKRIHDKMGHNLDIINRIAQNRKSKFLIFRDQNKSVPDQASTRIIKDPIYIYNSKINDTVDLEN